MPAQQKGILVRALISREKAGPAALVLDELPVPEIGNDEVLVKVSYCALNFPDLLIIEDKYQVRPQRPFTPGFEVSGEIVAVGAAVSCLSVGDPVMAIVKWGGCAEFVAAHQDQCFQIPEKMTRQTAAGMLFTFGTSLFALREGNVQHGDVLLVLGASGGIGGATVMLGKAMGAQVVAATSSAEKAELAIRLGADATIVYPAAAMDRDAQRALSKSLREACGPKGATVVCDPVGGDYAEAAFRALGSEGRYLILGFTAGIAKLPLNLPLMGSNKVIGISFEASAARTPGLRQTVIGKLLDLWRDEQVAPHISATFALDDAVEGMQLLASRRAAGKILIAVDPALPAAAGRT